MAVIKFRADLIRRFTRVLTEYGMKHHEPIEEMGVALLTVAYGFLQVGMTHAQIHEAIDGIVELVDKGRKGEGGSDGAKRS